MLVDQWFPFFDVGKTLEEMDRVFGRMSRPLGLRSVPRGTFPAINVYQQDDPVVLAVSLGKAERVKPKKIKIAVTA